MITPSSLEIETIGQDRKMRIITARFGDMEILSENIIHMSTGILGFPNCKQYILIPHKENSPFLWYQSVEDPSLAFVVMNPFLFNPDYDVPISPQLAASLGAKEVKELEVLAIVTIPKDRPQEMTANLLGPIIINSVKKLAKQIVLDPERYSTKTLLLPKS